MKDRSETIRAFLVAIVTALITIVGVALAQIQGSVSAQWALIAGFTIITLASMSLLVLVGSSFVLQYVKAAQEVRSDEILRDSVPTLVRFRSRTDVFTINSDGTADMEWRFEIEKGPRQRWTTLEFPIVTEGDRSFVANESQEELDPAFSVDVARVLVDGEDRTDESVLMLEERRSLIATHRSLNYGRLSVPVRLEEGNAQAKLQISVRFREIGNGGSDLEYAIVEVPYVTDQLNVEIRHQDPTCSIAPPINTQDKTDQRPVVATSAMGLTDSRETETESEKLLADRGSLIWQTAAPKLGYRYKVSFRIVRDHRAPPSASVTSRDPTRDGERVLQIFSL